MSMFIGFIYTVTHNESGKLYVGKTVKPFDRRWKEHLNNAKHGRGYYFQNALRKHGPEAFTFEIVDVSFAEEDLNRKEREMIRRECAADSRSGYNLTHGGEGVVPNEITRSRMSAAFRAVHARPGVKARISAASRALHARPDVKQRHAAALREAWARPDVKARHAAGLARPDTKARISAASKAAHARPEVRARMSAAIKEALARPEERARRGAAAKAVWEKRFIATVAWG